MPFHNKLSPICQIKYEKETEKEREKGEREKGRKGERERGREG